MEHFQILLQAAVADRSRVDRAGILLSGGLDSATVAATARELVGSAGGAPDLRAYTVVYESLIPRSRWRTCPATWPDFCRSRSQYIPWTICSRLIAGTIRNLRGPNRLTIPLLRALFDQFRMIASGLPRRAFGRGRDNLMHFEMWPYAQGHGAEQRMEAIVHRTAALSAGVRPSALARHSAAHQESFSRRSESAGVPGWLAPDFARR